MATTQVLVNSGEQLQVIFYLDGQAADPDAQAVTVTITRDDGTPIASAAATVRLDQGVYSYPLQPQSQLDHLTVTWSGAFIGITQTITTYVDIVGGYYVALAELRGMPSLADSGKYTTLKLIEARQWFEATAEKYCGQAFVPRYRRHRVRGTGRSTIYADRNVRTIRRVRDYSNATTYLQFSATDIANIDPNPNGMLTRVTGDIWQGGNGRNIELIYEYGMDACPADLQEAAKNAIRMKLLDNQTGHREYAVQTDVGIVRFGRPGMGRPTGDSDIDFVLNSYRPMLVR